MSRSTRAAGEAYCYAMVRRMVSLPRTLMGNFSRAMNQGIDLINPRTRRNQHLPSSFPLPYLPEPVHIQDDEWAFLATFEQQFGQFHPFFYVCRFAEALKIAENEHKFLFLYLHSPDYPFTPYFCRETLCSELVVQYLDANFVSWASIVNRGEGLHLSSTLQPSTFPFCAVVAPASGDNLAVLQQIEGPVSPAELVEILQRTMEEQGLAFDGSRAQDQEKRRAERSRLREEQDAAYLAALQIDQERERLQNLPLEQQRVQKQPHASNQANNEKQKQVQASSSKAIHEKNKQNPMQRQANKLKETTTSIETQPKDASSRGNAAQITQILIRFPNGDRKEQSFQATDKIQAIYSYIDSLNLPGLGNFRILSNFPRKVYGVDQMRTTLKDAGLHPKATLFVELL